jgi:hypothetical protein
VITGLDANGTSQTKRMKLVAGSTTTTMVITGATKSATKLYWTKISVLDTRPVTGGDSVGVSAYPYAGVTPSGAAAAGLFAGVTVDSFAAYGTGRICIFGPCDLRVNSNTTALIPGGMVETAAWGVGLTDAAATTGQNIARSIEYAKQDSLMTRVFIDRY